MLRVRFHARMLLIRYQTVWSPPLFTTCVCDVCRVRVRVRVLVRLSHPWPPDRNQHGCTVGVLPGPTCVLPMPRQYGIGRRAPNRAVLSCAASWCLVVCHPRRRVDCLVLTFCYVSSRTQACTCEQVSRCCETGALRARSFAQLRGWRNVRSWNSISNYFQIPNCE